MIRYDWGENLMRHNLPAFVKAQIALLDATLERFQSIWAWLVMAVMTVVTFFMNHIGGNAQIVMWLLELQVLDVIFGTYAGLTQRGKHSPQYRSDMGIRGIDMKVSTWLYIWAAHQLDIAFTGGGTTIRDIFIRLYAVHTLGSLLEIWVLLRWVGHDKVEKILVGRIRDLESWLIAKIPKFKAKVKEEPKDDTGV